MSTVTSSSSTSPSFTAGGLASNLDSASIIDGLVALQQQPLTLLQKQQSAYQSQISTLGSIASRLSALKSAAQALGTGGALAVGVTSSNTSFTATTGAGAAAGSYDLQVTGLAAAAKARSAGFASAVTVTGGSLDLAVDGKHYPTAAWKDGASLADVAAAIQASGAPVTAVVLDDGTNRYLSVTKRDTGYAVGSDPKQALVLTETSTGTQGHALGLAATQDPANASFTLDGLPFTRTSNTVSDALPGVTLALASKGSAETLTLANDVSGTARKLQGYVDAYNAVIQIVQTELSPAANTDRAQTLAGDATVRGLQQRLQGLGSQQVAGLGTVRTLSDLGIKTNRDGTLTLDSTALAAAVARSPSSVDALFSTASTGLAAVVGAAVDQYTLPASGLLSLAQSGLQDRVKQMDDQAATLQSRLDAYHATLQAQFTAMESVVSQWKTVGSFLSSQASQSTSK
ncbi:flagellar filament capping protein FliD [Anaeromyxobacter diazotrophicus]|uniref:Flagellar hook-associated protein 2 n=1 Tax=Anaeromyxobacter diazotrophicus TaxID=2590199 RepID=A0A7I9VRW1_9BACT|nr:flagellar filament capping protein FliD [Anaeromyxobacter diazotrophicus]GEJ59172.1 flagellar hook-associated protein 2 [Anaeromyxobacter diazotrophicus]